MDGEGGLGGLGRGSGEAVKAEQRRGERAVRRGRRGRPRPVRTNDAYIRAWWWVIIGSRGGTTRARIIRLLLDKPMNKHQIARALGLSYTTIEHHIRVLEEAELVEKVSDSRYGAPYYLTRPALDRLEALKRMVSEALEEGEGV